MKHKSLKETNVEKHLSERNSYVCKATQWGETKHKSLKETNAEKHLSTIFISKGEIPMPARITPKQTQAIRSRLWYMNMLTKAT